MRANTTAPTHTAGGPNQGGPDTQNSEGTALHALVLPVVDRRGGLDGGCSGVGARATRFSIPSCVRTGIRRGFPPTSAPRRGGIAWKSGDHISAAVRSWAGHGAIFSLPGTTANCSLRSNPNDRDRY